MKRRYALLAYLSVILASLALSLYVIPKVTIVGFIAFILAVIVILVVMIKAIN